MQPVIEDVRASHPFTSLLYTNALYVWFIILYNGEDKYLSGITALLELLSWLEYSMLHFDNEM